MRNKKSTLYTLVIAWITTCLLSGLLSPAYAALGSTVKQNQALIPEALINLSADYAILVDKKMQKLYAFQRNHAGVEKVFEAPCSTGKNSGPKMVSGDGKTPEGILFATRIYSDRELSSTYGCMAFQLNYPNLMDRKEGKNGNNIWIHGTNKKLRAFQSNGCITLTNKNILDLSSFIKLDETPIIIKHHINWVPENTLDPIKTELKSLLNVWWEALKKSDLQEMKRLYDSEESMDFQNLETLTEKLKSWKLSDLDVSCYPENISILHHDRYTIITFDQRIAYKNQSWKHGHCKLFLKKHQDRWSITGDRLQSADTDEQFTARLDEIDRALITRATIEGVITQWVKSWQSSDIQTYRSWYAPDFKGSGMSLKKWMQHKTSLIGMNKNIRITIENLEVIPRSTTVMATFTQRYESTGHSDIGTKTLRLKMINNQWKIYRESWRALQE